MSDEFHGDKILLTSHETPLLFFLVISTKLIIFNIIKFSVKLLLRLVSIATPDRHGSITCGGRAFLTSSAGLLFAGRLFGRGEDASFKAVTCTRSCRVSTDRVHVSVWKHAPAPRQIKISRILADIGAV